MLRDIAFRARIVAVGVQGPLGNHYGLPNLIIAMKQAHFDKITRRPTGEFLQSVVLSPIMLTPPSGRIG